MAERDSWGQCLNPQQEKASTALPSIEVLDHHEGEVSMQRQLLWMTRMSWGVSKYKCYVSDSCEPLS